MFRWTPIIAQAAWRTCHLQRQSSKRTGETERWIISIRLYLQLLLSLLCVIKPPSLSVCLRCANCFDCPCCMHTLSTRATNIPAPLPDDPTKTAMKKAYYLACGFCRWTSRDVGMADKSVGESDDSGIMGTY